MRPAGIRKQFKIGLSDYIISFNSSELFRRLIKVDIFETGKNILYRYCHKNIGQDRIHKNIQKIQLSLIKKVFILYFRLLLIFVKRHPGFQHFNAMDQFFFREIAIFTHL